MEHAKRGAEVLDSDPTKAIVEYTKALIEHPTSPDYYTQRAIAFSRVKPPNHTLALQDAETAVLCGQRRGRRDKIQAAQQRRVVALYNLGRFADAKLVLESMKKWRPENSKPQAMEHSMWEAKIVKKLNAEPQTATVAEYPSQALPSDSALIKSLKTQLKSDGTFNFEGEDVGEHKLTTQMSSSTQGVPSTSEGSLDKTTLPITLTKIRHEWYQNNQSVVVTLYAKGVAKTAAEVEMLEDSVTVSFPHPSDTSRSYTFTLDPLFALIDPKASKHTVLSTKIELTLAKSVQGQKWANLEGTEPLTKAVNISAEEQAHKAAIQASIQQPTVSAKAPSYPTSSKSGAKDWDKVASDLTAKPKKKKTSKKSDKENDAAKSDDSESNGGYESDYGGDAVDGFFKKLYAGADPDTRRAMMKSFQESNGTALSTNWGDVGSRKVEEVKSKDEA